MIIITPVIEILLLLLNVLVNFCRVCAGASLHERIGTHSSNACEKGPALGGGNGGGGCGLGTVRVNKTKESG